MASQAPEEPKAEFFASPESLRRQDTEARNADPEAITKMSDFGSYARANRGGGLSDSGIESHNLIAPMNRVRIYRCATRGVKIASIADLGSGLGFTSAALADVFSTKDVTGYEISKDACEFAARKWPALNFVAQALVPGTKLMQQYDLIIAQEFYPFNRTTDRPLHEQWIHTIADSLTKGGVALITLTEGSRESILSNLGHVKPILEKRGCAMTSFSLPFDRVYSWLPLYQLARLASNVLSILLKRPRFMAIRIIRNQ